MSPIIKIFKTTDELSFFFAELLLKRINEIDKNRFFSISLSGGSTPKAIFEFLAKNYKEKIPWNRIHLFWGDERCVEPENEESNYKMTRDFLINKISIPENNIFRIKGESNPEKEAGNYSEIVRNKVTLKSGIPQFDLIMLGLGDDGHTASIFPDNLKLFKTDNLFAAVKNPYTKQNRISATGKIINHASLIVFLVTGDSKTTMLSRIIKQKDGWDKLPASYVKPKNGEVHWLVDEKAASELNEDLDKGF